mgnify:CR=1 FL=1
MTTAAILAGGRARRLGGQDKGFLLVRDRPIIERQIEVLQAVADRVWIVANDEAKYAALGVPVVADLVEGAGSLGGILTALSIAGPEGALVVACDMPFLTAPFLAHLLRAGTTADVALPRTADGLHPRCACYAQTCADPIRRRLDAGRFRVLDMVATMHVREIGGTELSAFDPDGLLLLNVNTPDDLARARRQDRPTS